MHETDTSDWGVLETNCSEGADVRPRRASPGGYGSEPPICNGGVEPSVSGLSIAAGTTLPDLPGDEVNRRYIKRLQALDDERTDHTNDFLKSPEKVAERDALIVDLYEDGVIVFDQGEIDRLFGSAINHPSLAETK